MNKSTYIQTYYANASVQQKLGVIFDLYEGKGYSHFTKRYINDAILNNGFIDWRKRYETSNYMNLMVDEFMEFVPDMKELQGVSSTSDKTIEKKQDLFQKWLDKINWKSQIKNIGRLRKLGGDVYLHWWLTTDNNGFVYPKFKALDARRMEIITDEEENIIGYIWETTIEYKEKIAKSNAMYLSKSKTVKWEFLKGLTNIYEDGVLIDTVESKIEYADEFQLIHLQFMKEDDTPYSTIPCESLIDGCIRLDKIETTISTTNMQSGSPQLIIADGGAKASSGFGQNGILWLESTSSETGRQVKWGQLEITNGLQSMMLEWEQVLNTQYKRANLVQPKLLEKLTTTDSSKVVASIRINTENEIKDLFLEIQNKFMYIIEVLFKENKLYSKSDNLKFKLPDILINMSAFDEYLLRTQQMAIGIKTVQDNLRDYGYTVKQADKRIDELNEEIVNGKNDISINKTSTTTSDAVNNSDGLDNNLKGAINNE